MNHDGTEETFLTRGGSPTWSPAAPQGTASKMIAFHASASGTGRAIKIDPAQPRPTATSSSSTSMICSRKGRSLLNITNDPLAIDDDPEWSPDGEKIAFTCHDVNDDPLNSTTAEMYVINPDGTGRQQLTFNTEEERGPNWSPDGTLIVFMCRRGGPDFEICVMNADGTGQTQLTFNTFLRAPRRGHPTASRSSLMDVPPSSPQLYVMNSNGTGETQLTTPPGGNLIASSWKTIDTTAPVISGIPSAIVVEATSPAGAPVTYALPTAIDARDGAVAVNCAPFSGGTFSLGATTVTCSATDAVATVKRLLYGNRARYHAADAQRPRECHSAGHVGGRSCGDVSSGDRRCRGSSSRSELRARLRQPVPHWSHDGDLHGERCVGQHRDGIIHSESTPAEGGSVDHHGRLARSGGSQAQAH